MIFRCLKIKTNLVYASLSRILFPVLTLVKNSTKVLIQLVGIFSISEMVNRFELLPICSLLFLTESNITTGISYECFQSLFKNYLISGNDFFND